MRTYRRGTPRRFLVAGLVTLALAWAVQWSAEGSEAPERAGTPLSGKYVSVVEFDETSTHIQQIVATLRREADDPDERGFLLFGPTGHLEASYPRVFTSGTVVDLYVLAWTAQKQRYSVTATEGWSRDRVGPVTTRCEVTQPGNAVTQGKGQGHRPAYCLLKWRRGPFASGTLRIVVTAPGSSSGDKTHLQTHEVVIQAAAHCGVRLAVLGSNLQQQDFAVVGGLLRKTLTSNPVNPALEFVWYLNPAGVSRTTSPTSWRNRINPMVGLPFDRLWKRWYAGVDVTLTRDFSLNCGVQIEQVTELSPNSALEDANGQVQARTQEGWRTAPFLGVSVDAGRLFDSIGRWFDK